MDSYKYIANIEQQSSDSLKYNILPVVKLFFKELKKIQDRIESIEHRLAELEKNPLSYD